MQSRSPVQRYLPVAYLGIAFVLTAALLPTALRPPPQQPPTSAELSPDAPPDDEQILLTELAQGTSSTAGAGVSDLVPGEGPETGPPPVELKPRKGRCFGNPPRQAESIYSPPCAPAWSGDNGGATYRGVSADEIRWGIVISGSGYEGPADQEGGDEPAIKRTYRVWQQYFNDNYELYGRRVRFFLARAGSNNWQESSNSRAAAQKLAKDFGVMGLTIATTATPAEDEGLKLGLMVFGGSHHEIQYYRRNSPLAWAFVMDGTKLTELQAELICKQLWDKPTSFSGDSMMNGRPRKYGVLSYNDAAYRGYHQVLADALERGCGGTADDVQLYNVDNTPDQLAGVMTKFRAQGITTVVCLCDGFAPIIFTNSADQQGYFPEWVHGGSAAMDDNGTAALYAQRTQWKNSIGLSSNEINGARPSGSNGFRAYKTIDPDGEPEDGPFNTLTHLVGAMQVAGPILTPDAIRDGLIKNWPPRPPEPIWTMGGGYGPDDWTFSDYVSLIWWDPSAPRPQSSLSGAYRYVWEGKRFKLGELPSEPIPFFDPEGTITEPPEDEKL